MKWEFWTNKKNKTLAEVQEVLVPINQQLTLLNQQVTGSSEQIMEISEQVRKLGRLQYKSGQDVQGKLEGLSSGLNGVQQWQVAYTVDKSHLDTLEQQIGQVREILLAWLDDLDLLASSLREQGQKEWLSLLRTWNHQVLRALQINGISEMQLVGTSFNPMVAESIGTITRESVKTAKAEEENGRVFLPYEVAEVVKRGFVYQDGTLLRKAQVITYQEDEHERN